MENYQLAKIPASIKKNYKKIHDKATLTTIIFMFNIIDDKFMKKSTYFFGTAGFLLVILTTGCQKSNETVQKPTDDILVGCYTVSRDEPAQIKISQTGQQYTMQMREFNDPTKAWDKGEPLEALANTDSELQKYFDIKTDEHQYVEKVIARADRVFVLAKISDSFMNINPQFDSPYLGFIYKGSNTIYKTPCETTK